MPFDKCRHLYRIHSSQCLSIVINNITQLVLERTSILRHEVYIHACVLTLFPALHCIHNVYGIYVSGKTNGKLSMVLMNVAFFSTERGCDVWSLAAFGTSYGAMTSYIGYWANKFFERVLTIHQKKKQTLCVTTRKFILGWQTNAYIWSGLTQTAKLFQFTNCTS